MGLNYLNLCKLTLPHYRYSKGVFQRCFFQAVISAGLPLMTSIHIDF